MRNLSIALIEHKRISTTLAKAKVLRSFLEPIITKSKDNTTHSRRTVFSLIGNKEAVKELFDNISLKIADRPGGYLRVIRTGFRLGDGAETALIEFVDYNETYNAGSKSGVAKSSRRGRRRGKSESSAENIVAASAPVAAAVISDIAPEVNGEEEE
ncbi:MAG TPA: 50S ribosomal protein L17 [Saprospiraceae bacterium]|nr:50S ribosomal protein L17 [Saprospiraceae bacterium]